MIEYVAVDEETPILSFQIDVCLYSYMELRQSYDDVHSISTLDRHKVKFTKYKLVSYGKGRIRYLS
jgi:hypothetical protein